MELLKLLGEHRVVTHFKVMKLSMLYGGRSTVLEKDANLVKDMMAVLQDESDKVLAAAEALAEEGEVGKKVEAMVMLK